MHLNPLSWFALSLAALLAGWILVSLGIWAFWIRTGRRGLLASMLWPVWLPPFLLSRVYGYTTFLARAIDDFVLRDWTFWARDFCVLAAHGGVDRAILKGDPHARMLSRALDRMAFEHAGKRDTVKH